MEMACSKQRNLVPLLTCHWYIVLPKGDLFMLCVSRWPNRTTEALAPKLLRSIIKTQTLSDGLSCAPMQIMVNVSRDSCGWDGVACDKPTPATKNDFYQCSSNISSFHCVAIIVLYFKLWSSQKCGPEIAQHTAYYISTTIHYYHTLLNKIIPWPKYSKKQKLRHQTTKKMRTTAAYTQYTTKL